MHVVQRNTILIANVIVCKIREQNGTVEYGKTVATVILLTLRKIKQNSGKMGITVTILCNNKKTTDKKNSNVQ